VSALEQCSCIAQKHKQQTDLQTKNGAQRYTVCFSEHGAAWTRFGVVLVDEGRLRSFLPRAWSFIAGQSMTNTKRDIDDVLQDDVVENRSIKEAAAKGSQADSSTITISTPHTYSKRNPVAYQQPTQIASFSFDEERRLHHDDRSRRFYHPPPRNVNLNHRFEQRIDRDDSVDEHLDGLLASLINLGSKDVDQDRHRAQADVITWRGMMTKMCTIMYEDRQGFEMNAMLVGDTLYIEEYISPERKAEEAGQSYNERGLRLAYHGYSLESYTCHAWRDWQPGCDVWDGDVNTNVQWGSVVKTKLGDLRLVLGGEVDAIDPQTEEPVEIKATMQIRSARDEERFETKMLRFYMQSFLLGVQRVVVGFRDHRGNLVTHQDITTLAMPRAVRGKAHGWDPNACLIAASDLLTALRRIIKANSSAVFSNQAQWPSAKEAERSAIADVFRLSYRPTNTSTRFVTVRKLTPDEVHSQVKEGKDAGRVGFLTSEYYSYAKQQKEA
jgi:RAT1-interacting protein